MSPSRRLMRDAMILSANGARLQCPATQHRPFRAFTTFSCTPRISSSSYLPQVLPCR